MSKKSATSIPGIYVITNAVSGTVYVGQAINIRKRWEIHRSTLASGKHANCYLQRAWAKYGADAFRFAVERDMSDIPKTELAEALNRAEIEILASFQGVYNLMEAGASGVVASEATRALLSTIRTAHWADPDKRAAHLAAQQAAMTPEFQARRMAAAIEGIRTPEARARRSVKSKALWATEEHRAAMSARRKANWADPAYRAKQAESRRKSWADPESRARRMAGLQAAAENPEILEARRAGVIKVRDQIAEKHRIKWQDPEYRARQSISRKEGQKARYADPAARAKQSEIAKAMWARRKAAAEAAD